MKRIAIAGISLEASTFSPARTTLEQLGPFRGREILQGRSFWRPGGSLEHAAEWVPIVHARGIPGGPIPAETYDALKGEILEGLRAALPLDGVVLDIHGAASVVGRDDMEADLAGAIREVVGPQPLISCGMDLHGNVSGALARAVDLLTCYRTAPHVDWEETKERAVRNLLARLDLPQQRRRLHKAWARVPVLLPGEKTSTRIEPAASLYARVAEVARLPGVLDAGYWIGYPWADEPRNHGVVMVIGDDPDRCREECTALARAAFAARDDFAFVAPTATLADALAAAATSPVAPYVISDAGDNPTAGGAGDVTWTLARILEDDRLAAAGKRLIYASIPDAEAAERLAAAGAGAMADVEVGARVDARHEGPVRLRGEVRSVTRRGLGYADVRTPNLEVVVRCGNVDVIVSRTRRPYHLVSDFTGLGIDPTAVEVLVVKIGYLEPELFELAADWVLALTPGGVDQDLLRLGHRRLQRPIYPWDTDFGDFQPTAVLV